MLNQKATVNVVEGQYFRDLMDQPGALRATLAELEDGAKWKAIKHFVTSRPWKRIVLTGMGSSFHTLHPLNLSLIGAGFTPVLMETAELAHYGLALCGADTLIILVSQSGKSAEAMLLLETNRDATVLGITNTRDSPLARESDLALVTRAGPEFSVSCKTYVVGMLVLQWLAALFAGKDERDTLNRLATAPGLAREYLEKWSGYVDVLAGVLRGSRHLFLAGRGPSLAAVGTGALIIKESSHFHAEGMSSAAFRHGPLEMLGRDVTTFVFEGDGPTRVLNRQLVSELVAGGCNCEGIGPGARLESLRIQDCDPLVRPIVEILPVELMTLALAGLAHREAGKFERASKVTTTE
jgi:glucosamine--fructose-6-phosphate aminotransferase (isomerizing)